LARYKRKFRSLRQHRYEVLRDELFTKTEARQLSRFKFKQPYIRQMRVDRRKLARDVRKLHLPRREALAELRWRVRKIYEINGWADAYAMMRWYRQVALERGEYTPPVKKRPRLNKSNVKAQKEHWRAKRAARQPTGGGARYPVIKDGKETGEYVRFNYDTGRFEPV